MIPRLCRWYGETTSPVFGYSIAMLLGAAAQVARIPLPSPAEIPFITYVPFIVLGAAVGGFGPGLLTTAICILECMYFATQPFASFKMLEPHLWGALGVLAFTGLVTSALFEFLRRNQGIAMDLRAAYAQLAAIYVNAPVVLLVIDEQLHVQAANDLAARFAGREVSGMPGLRVGGALRCLNALTDPRGCGHQPSCDRCALRVAIFETLATGTRREGMEAWLPVRVDGQWQRRCLLVSTTAMKLDRATKVLVCAQDITDRKQAESDLARQRDELERQAALINFSHDAIITADANRVIRGWNRGAEEMYGWTEAEAIGNMTNLFLRTSNCRSMAQNDEVLAREDQWDGELEHSRRDEQRILVESRQVALRNAAGTDLRILEINRDITQRRRAEDALKETVRLLESALTEKTVLLKEIHHRVKNNLAVTASLLSMKADGSGPEARLALEESQQRIHSIALVHEYLYDNDHLDRVNFGEYARDLAQGVFSAFGGGHKRIGLDLELNPIELGIERAVPCALILNELLSNAFKYAFAGGRTGRILVSFRQPEPACYELAVEDDGVGLPDGALGGENRSLGLRIVRILTKQLDGAVEQKACPGTRIVLRFPAAA